MTFQKDYCQLQTENDKNIQVMEKFFIFKKKL